MKHEAIKTLIRNHIEAVKSQHLAKGGENEDLANAIAYAATVGSLSVILEEALKGNVEMAFAIMEPAKALR